MSTDQDKDVEASLDARVREHLLLSRAVPGVAWAPYPVPNPPRGAPLRAVAGEYTKYLAAASGLSAWLPAREAAKGGNG